MPRASLLATAGALRAEYEAVDWAATPLGPIEAWNRTLRRSVELALHTRFPVTLFWGEDLTLVYNEAYVGLIDDKHPAALGRPAHEVFPEAWHIIGPMLEHVCAGEGATWFEDELVPLHRGGILEEAYFTFSYSPVLGDDGAVEGVLDIAVETTRQVVDRRRLALLARLREELGHLRRADDLAAATLPVLRLDLQDLPEADVRLSGTPSGLGAPGLPDAPSVPPDLGLSVQTTPSGPVAWVPLGGPRDGAQPLLVVRLSSHQVADDAYLDFLRLLGSTIARALDRLHALEAERGLLRAERRMSAALQRSLLTTPPRLDGLEIAVRYEAAAEEAQIGGDWYDAFVLPDGMLTVVVGDVAGHDSTSAAAMAQVRNLLRGVAFTREEPPHLVLGGLDAAMRGLSPETSATAVLAQVPAAVGPRRLDWCNAGHPPPLLLSPDGDVRLLDDGGPNLLLGLDEVERRTSTIDLPPGTSVVLFSDGLVERRDAPMQDSLAWLMDVVRGRHDLTAEQLCDHVLAQLDGPAEDDVVLLVLRTEA